MARMYEGKFNLNELHKQVAEGLKHCIEDRCNTDCPYISLSNCEDILEADVATTFRFIYFICETLAKDFDCPCNFSPIDETMWCSEWCENDCGKLTDAQCWLRYFEYLMTKKEGETDERLD